MSLNVQQEDMLRHEEEDLCLRKFADSPSTSVAPKSQEPEAPELRYIWFSTSGDEPVVRPNEH